MFATLLAVLAIGGLSATDAQDKFIVVDLKDQTMTCFEGLEAVMQFSVSTARPGKKTPTGTFFIHDKRTRGKALPKYGGGTLYYPQRLVGHILIHGYHSVPAYPASNGCIRMHIADAKKLYTWTDPGTRVQIEKDVLDCLL
ncbi:MAG: L,D-transpeptidase [Candidatus Berkelbacteria bacterium]|nr:MAG: L,D-transpeptidase [Candidatus Berkelbacteria bacterium]QQG51513.1 MAG: L,D-transpeptidase [Candidatus Berkelbacteria bacterium]